jgi:ubiquinone/menaquinone biosynthesis C-methylase UbiE
MLKQKNLFLNSEGNKYFNRNKKKLDFINYENDPISIKVKKLIGQSKKFNILEVGCGDGKRLKYLKKQFSKSNFYGIDPSSKAISNPKNVKLKKGTADKLPFRDNKFDIVIFGFCLYLCDDNDLFKICDETFRVSKENSWIIILDFYSENLYYKKYKHNKKILARKMNYANLFSWHPNIDIESQAIMSHEDNNKWTDNSDNKISISCLRKSRHRNIK